MNHLLINNDEELWNKLVGLWTRVNIPKDTVVSACGLTDTKIYKSKEFLYKTFSGSVDCPACILIHNLK